MTRSSIYLITISLFSITVNKYYYISFVVELLIINQNWKHMDCRVMFDRTVSKYFACHWKFILFAFTLHYNTYTYFLYKQQKLDIE